MMDFEESGKEGVECFHHIGDIVTGTSNADAVNGNADDEEEAHTNAPPATYTNKKKNWVATGAAVIVVSLALSIGIIISGSGRKEKISASASLATEPEIPWWACIDQDVCFQQAEQLGYADEDFRAGDYSYAGLYGCFRKNTKVYWGTGGTDAQMITTEFPGAQERIWCYDVKDNPLLPLEDNCDSVAPSVHPSYSSTPSASGKPSPVPSISLRPSITSKPTASPSNSSRPSTSSQPSDFPSTSARPSEYPSR
jgi:hypothetical protein